MYDLIIIGAGPAGMTAALYAVRNNKKVLLLEKNVVGGQIINTPLIENYPAINKIKGIEYVEQLNAQIENAHIVNEMAVKLEDKGDKKYVYTNENAYIGRAVIIATGLTRKKLGIEGEKELIGKGVSYCATCDGPFFKGKAVAVIGGGNTALLEAAHLAGYCKNVFLICRSDRFKGEEKNLEKVKEKSNIIIYKNTIPQKIIGEDKVQAIEVLNGENNTIKIIVEGVFAAIGQRFSKDFVFEGLNDNDDYIMADESCKTSVEGVFVAGDCRNKKVRQLVTATADGAVAALAALEYIN